MQETSTEPYILPRVPSQLIRIALEDLEKAEQDEGIVIEMETWHEPVDGYQGCAICAAGAVMRERLGVEDDEYAMPNDCGVNEDQLVAINRLRIGTIDTAFSKLGIDEIPPFGTVHITDYSDNPAAFKSDMRALADRLEAAGF